MVLEHRGRGRYLAMQGIDAPVCGSCALTLFFGSFFLAWRSGFERDRVSSRTFIRAAINGDFEMLPILLIVLSSALPVRKDGPCPPGYSSSAKFCIAGAGTAVAVDHMQSCPSGMTRSGHYCVSRPSR